MPRGYVITGTDTGVGKTIVAAALVRALGADYWKPIQAGLAEPTDSEIVERLSVGSFAIVPEAYRLTTPCSPHEAGRLDGISIELSRLSLPRTAGPLIVEGAGGLMVPIGDDKLMIHLFVLWSLPVILVARTALGTINHSLLSIAALRQSGLELAGIVFVGEENASSEAAIVRFGKVRHLGRLPWLRPLSAESLSSAVDANLRLNLLE